MLEKNAVRPLRSYQQMVGSKGPFIYAVVTWPPRGPDLNELMLKGEVITEAQVKGKLDELGIDLAGDGPREVVEHLNLMRVTVHAEEALSPVLKPYEEDIKSIEKCINVLLQKLPKEIEAHLKVATVNELLKFDSKRAVVSAARFNALLQATEAYLRDRWSAFGGRSPSRRHAAWHCDAIHLMGLCNIAQGKSDLLSGVKEESPIVKFIVWAFDYVGNKPRTHEAIAQALNRRIRPVE